MSSRTRELGFLVPGLLIGLLGVATVASARADAFEYGPLPGLAAVVAIGLVELDRISPTLARDQVVWIAIGGAVFVGVVVFLRDPHVLERYRYLMGLGGVALLIATMVFGTTINGSRLWI